MNSVSYEITSLIARYLLVLLCAIVLLRTIFISRNSRIKNIYSTNIEMAKLILINENKEYTLNYDNTIGSSNKCDIQIHGQNIANIHVQIYKQNNKWLLCVYSKNFTLLNEIKVVGTIEINSYDVIRLGEKDYRFISQKGENL